MEPAITTGCVTPERIVEAIALGVQMGARGYFVHASQWIANEQTGEFPALDVAGGKFCGFYEALSGAGFSLCGADSDVEHAKERLRGLCVEAHSKGGGMIILGGKDARELAVRATTSEVHAMLGDFFDGVMPVFESRNMILVLDIAAVGGAEKRRCLDGVPDVLRFFNQYRHPLLRLGLRAKRVDESLFDVMQLREEILPNVACVIFDDIENSMKEANQLAVNLRSCKYAGLVMLEVGAAGTEGTAALRRGLSKLQSLIEA